MSVEVFGILCSRRVSKEPPTAVLSVVISELTAQAASTTLAMVIVL